MCMLVCVCVCGNMCRLCVCRLCKCVHVCALELERLIQTKRMKWGQKVCIEYMLVYIPCLSVELFLTAQTTQKLFHIKS